MQLFLKVWVELFVATKSLQSISRIFLVAWDISKAYNAMQSFKIKCFSIIFISFILTLFFMHIYLFYSLILLLQNLFLCIS